MEIERGKIEGAQKVVLYAPEGIGKSTFASKFPDAIFIDTEGSTKKLDVARTKPNPSSWMMLLEQVRYFIRNPHELGTLIVDTADWAEKLCIAEVCAKHGKSGIEDFGYGKGPVYVGEEFGKLLNLLTELIDKKVNVVLVAHANTRKFDLPEETGSFDKWEMKLTKYSGPMVKEWADMVLFATYKTFVVQTGEGMNKKNKAQGGKRVMYTSHHPCWDAKNRHDLAPELDFDFAKIAHCIPQYLDTRAGTKPTHVSASTQPSQDRKPAQVEEEVSYWHHPESCCVFTGPKGEYPGGDGLSMEISKEQYEKLKREYEEAEKASQTSTTATPPSPQKPTVNLDEVPKPLADLMLANNVTVEEIQKAVASRGYYPENTPIEKYDSNFVSGVLVGAWPQVYQMIQDFKSDKPY